ncbi:thiamine phosphate synthase [Halobacillus sp. BBL2006]|uniref:thiamine phosphate synthase n=1 Tax=Halobacillus sp. BBL2006 TaxID=1543706 RepID=UPI0005429C18|nr:thiamine phosphate synthase [Halobacillus sp. BBL2006]KHE72575.1 thiamine-phosphate pyrophosphorylase [Halobacillus sp. BBL2006]
MSLSNNLRKYLVMGSQNCKRDPQVILKEAIEGGITAFQYREKGPGSLTGKEKLELGARLREICKAHDVLFFINDDLDLAEPLKADGIHVGQEDEHVEKVRELFQDKIIGLSVSNTAELLQSPIDKVDYLGAGPIFSTQTKKDAKPVTGTEWVKVLKHSFPDLPIVGIGGIHPGNAAAVIESGASGVAVVSAITHSKDIKKAIAEL